MQDLPGACFQKTSLATPSQVIDSPRSIQDDLRFSNHLIVESPSPRIPTEFHAVSALREPMGRTFQQWDSYRKDCVSVCRSLTATPHPPKHPKTPPGQRRLILCTKILGKFHFSCARCLSAAVSRAIVKVDLVRTGTHFGDYGVYQLGTLDAIANRNA